MWMKVLRDGEDSYETSLVIPLNSYVYYANRFTHTHLLAH